MSSPTAETVAASERAALASVLDAHSAPLPPTLTRIVEAAPESWSDPRHGAIAVAVRTLCAEGRAVTPDLVLPLLADDQTGAALLLAALPDSALPLDLAEVEAGTVWAAYESRQAVARLTVEAEAHGLTLARPGSLAAEYLGADDDAPSAADEDTLRRLAALPPLEYERVREMEAEKLQCRTSILDKLVDARRPKPGAEDGGGPLQGSAVSMPDVEPWPDPVDGVALLAAIAETFSRYVALPDGAADVLALWIAHAHGFDAFSCSPRLNISSPEKGCGKTTLRDVAATLVPRPVPTENVTTAVLFRLVQAHSPTILADECDAWLKDNEELRGLLNAGHKRGGQALRCEGDNHEVRAFNVFGPVVLCGIGALPGTLHDRSIVIRLTRAKPGELRTRFDSRRTAHEQELSRKLARWCADHAAQLEAADPALPPGAFNRLGDNWRPLFAIAEIAGGDWPARAASAFTQLTSREDSDAQGLGVMLLADIRLAFAETHEDRMFSKALVNALCAITERPWPEAHRGKPITETWLARRLKSFSIVSRNVRTGTEQAKGYELESFADAFARYLPTERETKRPSVPSPANIDVSPLSEASRAETVGRIEKPVSANKDGLWDAGTDGKRGDADKEPELAQADLI